MVLHLGRGNLSINTNWRDEWVEGSPDEKVLPVLVEEKLGPDLAAQKANHILSCTESSVACTSREMIFPIYSVLP